MSRTLRQAATTFVVVLIVLILMHMVLHSGGGSFSISRQELMHQLLVGIALTLALTLTRGRRP